MAAAFEEILVLGRVIVRRAYRIIQNLRTESSHTHVHNGTKRAVLRTIIDDVRHPLQYVACLTLAIVVKYADGIKFSFLRNTIRLGPYGSGHVRAMPVDFR